LVLISLSAVFLVKTVPPVKARYENTVKDIYSIIENKNPNFQSLGQRWAAIKCTTEIIKRNIWFGVSPSDLKDEMQTQYQKDSYLLIPENRIFIHNQFLYYAASFGIPFTVIIFIVFLILIIKETKKNQLIFWLMVPFFLHMFSDNTLERQISGGCILFFLLLLPNLNMKSQT
jgi:O-antigen ligase